VISTEEYWKTFSTIPSRPIRRRRQDSVLHNHNCPRPGPRRGPLDPYVESGLVDSTGQPTGVTDDIGSHRYAGTFQAVPTTKAMNALESDGVSSQCSLP